MRRVLRRIAIHGAMTGVVLCGVGFMLAELASMWLVSAPGTRNGPEAVSVGGDEVSSMLHTRVPLFMALWGFGFVAVGEVGLHFWRSRRPAPLPPQPQQNSDEAEKLLLELLAQAESKTHKPLPTVDSPTPPPENSPHPNTAP